MLRHVRKELEALELVGLDLRDRFLIVISFVHFGYLHAELNHFDSALVKLLFIDTLVLLASLTDIILILSISEF